MATLQDLVNATRSYKKSLFDNSDSIKVVKVSVSRFVNTGAILFSAKTRDITTKNDRECQIRFEVPQDEDVKTYIPRIKKDTVAVKSNSPFFKFAFGFNNKSIGAHAGPVARFSVKGTGKPINPNNSPGLDKHLIALVKCLTDKGLIK